jgi:hypothetical protein
VRLPVIKIVPDDVTIWLVYAGVRRRHLNDFLRSRSVFLELPGFVADERTFDSLENIEKSLAVSNAVRRWLIDQRGARPSAANVSPQTFEPGSAEARGFASQVGNITRMFVDMKVGDVVLCPPIGHYLPMLIGEVTEEWRPNQVISLPFFDQEPMPVRKVRWLSERLTRSSFPPKVSRYLQNQHAISQVDPSFS